MVRGRGRRQRVGRAIGVGNAMVRGQTGVEGSLGVPLPLSLPPPASEHRGASTTGFLRVGALPGGLSKRAEL